MDLADNDRAVHLDFFNSKIFPYLELISAILMTSL